MVKYEGLNFEELLDIYICDRVEIPLEYYMIVFLEYLNENHKFIMPSYDDLVYIDFHKMTFEQFESLPKEVIHKKFVNSINKKGDIEYQKLVEKEGSGWFDGPGAFDLSMERDFLEFEEYLRLLFEIKNGHIENMLNMDVLSDFEEELIYFKGFVPFSILIHIDFKKRFNYLKSIEDYNFLRAWPHSPLEGYAYNLKTYLKDELLRFVKKYPQFKGLVDCDIAFKWESKFDTVHYNVFFNHKYHKLFFDEDLVNSYINYYDDERYYSSLASYEGYITNYVYNLYFEKSDILKKKREDFLAENPDIKKLQEDYGDSLKELTEDEAKFKDEIATIEFLYDYSGNIGIYWRFVD